MLQSIADLRVMLLFLLCFLNFQLLGFGSLNTATAAWDDPQKTSSADTQLEDAVIAAFKNVHQGYSVDEVLITPALRSAFVTEVQQNANADERTINLTLLRLRKTGKLKVTASRRGTQPFETFRHTAEIAARLTADTSGASTDEMIADPLLRSQLLTAAREVDANAPEYDILKHVLNLRKARKLRPELVLRVAQWPRQIETISLEKLQSNPTLAPELPGIYLFRSEQGYLYIGEASNLSKRLQEHTSPSSDSPLSQYLSKQSTEPITIEIHAFTKDSPAAKISMRRAYESELIRSRNPKLNIRP